MSLHANAPTTNAPGEVIWAMLHRRMPLLAGRPIDFDVPDWLLLVRLDAALLDQTLANLLDDFAPPTPAGTALALHGGIDQTGWLRLEGDGAGPDIPRSARERIVEKFQRLDQEVPGAGLGLALARAAVQAQGGQVWVESSPLGGARFVVRVPGAPPRRIHAGAAA